MFAYITNITYITNYVTNTINTYEGAGHLWHVSIAEQPSVTPTTAYDQPMVASFAVLPTTLGLGSNDTMQLTSDGGQEITIKGTKFGPMLPSGQVPYLNPNTGVTYGPTGVEYVRLRGCWNCWKCWNDVFLIRVFSLCSYSYTCLFLCCCCSHVSTFHSGGLELPCHHKFDRNQMHHSCRNGWATSMVGDHHGTNFCSLGTHHFLRSTDH